MYVLYYWQGILPNIQSIQGIHTLMANFNYKTMLFVSSNLCLSCMCSISFFHTLNKSYIHPSPTLCHPKSQAHSISTCNNEHTPACVQARTHTHIHTHTPHTHTHTCVCIYILPSPPQAMCFLRTLEGSARL